MFEPFSNHNASVEKARKQNFEKLKKLLNSPDENGKLNEYYQAYEYIVGLEVKNELQGVEITKYRNFFSSLFSLLPKPFTENTIIR